MLLFGAFGTGKTRYAPMHCKALVCRNLTLATLLRQDLGRGRQADSHSSHGRQDSDLRTIEQVSGAAFEQLDRN
jgi:histidine ammonia-lyase